MQTVTSVEAVEAIIGTPPQAILMKVSRVIDAGCRGILANSPLAGFGYHSAQGLAQTTIVGGQAGFANVESPTRLSFDFDRQQPLPTAGSGVSMIFLLPGIGETLRLNGTAAAVSNGKVAVNLEETWVHCARCILRSRLWNLEAQESNGTRSPTRQEHLSGPLANPEVRTFLDATPFLLVSSWDASGHGDTSPKGDPVGFVRILDGETILIPDRRGNKRADTFHNLMSCAEVSLAALVPGRDDLLQLNGTAEMTIDPDLLTGTGVRNGETPKAGLVVHVRQAAIRPNEAIRAAQMWRPTSHVNRAATPDLLEVATRHIARSEATGRKASLMRTVSRGLGLSPKLLRRATDIGYRKELEDEGY
jgi:predicted pyridoxine 5'-phosphate oxidase superfamily flavin-nucleotide-binding protein